MRWLRPVLVGVLSAAFARDVRAQTKTGGVDSLRLRYMRIRTEASDSCIVMIRTSGSMGIDSPASPGDLRAWVDSAKVLAAARRPTNGQRAEYRFETSWIGLKRTITSRFDAFEFIITGHTIPILASEVPRIARLFDSADARTIRMSPRCRG
jgi:hypothetical protein